ncbi:polyprenyl synthetase family protein, partial [uncultured Microbacterium sp.]|uniref:polyprenyl synthetase family protein n=1 Tax=uncultured Microbacterium sp. TaxID=191216 RepID=UPI0037DC8CAD
MSASDDPIEAVSQRLASFVTDQSTTWQHDGPEAAGFVRAGADALTGGKRLRARFCLAGWQAVTETRSPAEAASTPGDDVIAAAAALEIFHAAALVHDDLIDNSDTRRGRPAAHRALEAAHRAAGWAGDAE